MPVYNLEFFSGHRDDSCRSAAAVVPLLIDLLKPASVVDVGCGIGTWLAAFNACGVADLLGIDGDWVNREALEIPIEQFHPADLSRPFDLGRRFDMVLSLEVAEHLEAQHAPTFIDSLVCLGPAVVFSAAIPHQGGTHHVNEQWPDYWADMFRERGYTAVDCIRREIWANNDVRGYYAQNILMYLSAELVEKYRATLGHAYVSDHGRLAMVHPETYRRAIARTARRVVAVQNMGLGPMLRLLPATVFRSIGYRLGRKQADG